MDDCTVIGHNAQICAQLAKWSVPLFKSVAQACAVPELQAVDSCTGGVIVCAGIMIPAFKPFLEKAAAALTMDPDLAFVGIAWPAQTQGKPIVAEAAALLATYPWYKAVDAANIYPYGCLIRKECLAKAGIVFGEKALRIKPAELPHILCGAARSAGSKLLLLPLEGVTNIRPRGAAPSTGQPPVPVPQPVPPGPSVWGQRAAFVQVFPELAEAFDKLAAQATAAGCASCKRNSLLRQLTVEIKKLPARDTGPLRTAIGDQGVAQLTGGLPVASKPAVKTEAPALDRGPRPGCADCVGKHVAQATILLGESLLGYPSHRWLAIGHLAEAAEECLELDRTFAEEIRALRLRMMDDRKLIPDLTQLFDKIDTLRR